MPLADLPALQREVRARAAGLLGTILLAPEGINGMVTGENLAHFHAYLTELGVKAQQCKWLDAPEHAFHRLLVKIKKEVISVGAPVDPASRTAPRLSAEQLREWLEAGDPDLVLLDTRNEYEIEVGTFQGAVSLGLDASREFAAKAAAAKTAWTGKKVVTFCTGGIRCEKASAVLLDLGVENVFQLDGGILRYFERNGAAHFAGNCFVFDWRLAVDGALRPAPRSEDPSRTFGRHRA